MSRYSSERGQSAVLLTLAMTTMLGVLGLVTDIGWSYYRKEVARAAAQAAALGAAQAALASAGGGLDCSSGVYPASRHISAPRP